jgi:predicted O-methyltransferase YrrM
LVTIEKFDHFAGICRQNFAANEVSDRIELIEGDAFDVLDRLTEKEPFDIAVIDGDKGRYDSYFAMVDKLVRPGGLVYVDDVFFHGDALNQNPTTEKGRGVQRFLDALSKSQDYVCSVLPIANGVALAIKRNT